LAFYLLLAAILTFGFLLYAAQGTQHVADLAAREISRLPLAADATLEEVLYGNANVAPELADVRARVFDEHYLVLNLDTLQGEATLEDLIGKLPVVNQQLVPLMISDSIGATRVLRFPGAVFEDADPGDDPQPPRPPGSGWLVRVPIVTGRNADGTEGPVHWVRVLEEMEPADPLDLAHDPFRITSQQRGLVALRVNYPYQSAVMSGFRPNPAGPFEPTIGHPIPADDSGISVVNPDEQPGALVGSDYEFGPYAGPFGLGQQGAMRSEPLTEFRHVRPFRRVIASQGVYRREVFGPEEF
jgi:hypothetical protein